MEDADPNLEGYCLVAQPALKGSPFGGTVILITHDDPAEGTLGVILNKPLNKKFNEFFDGRWPLNVALYNGGPVQRQTLALIGFRQNGTTLEVRSHLTPEQAIGFLQEAPEFSELRAYLGYAGWDAGQLHEELNRKDWGLLPLTPALLGT